MHRTPTRQRKSPLHLLFLPLILLGGAAFCYSSVQIVCAVAGLFRPGIASFANLSEPAKTLIVIPLLFASIPVGLLLTNLVIWIIPPARRFFNREAAERPGEDFASSNRDLLKIAKYSIPPLLFFVLRGQELIIDMIS
jgi:hypothetical protein